MHCEYNDSHQVRFSHGLRDRDVRYSRTIVNTHYVSSAFSDDNDAQPGASAAATSTANKTMHNQAAFHTAGVTATCATLASLSTRTT
jgi:hypothetical protein